MNEEGEEGYNRNGQIVDTIDNDMKSAGVVCKDMWKSEDQDKWCLLDKPTLKSRERK